METTYDLPNSLFYIHCHPGRDCKAKQNLWTFDGVAGVLSLDENKEWVGIEFQLQGNPGLTVFLGERPFAVQRTWSWSSEAAIASSRVQGFNLDFCEEGLHGVEIPLRGPNEDVGLGAFQAVGKDISSVFPWLWTNQFYGPVTDTNRMTRKGLSRSGFMFLAGGAGVMLALILTPWKYPMTPGEAYPSLSYLAVRLGASILGGMALMGGLWLLLLGLFRKKRA